MKKFLALLLVVLMLLSACSKEPTEEQSGAQSGGEPEISESEAPEETEPKDPEVVFPTVLDYDAEGPQIQYIRWLWENTLFWVEFHGEAKIDYGLQELNIMDVETGEKRTVYSVDREELVFPTIIYTDSKVYVLFDFYPERQVVVFDRNTWEVIEEISLDEDLPAYIDISAKEIIYTAPSQYSNDIVFFSLSDPDKTYGLKLDPVPRYNNGAGVWSRSGDYLMLNNFDACGYDKYSCHAEVLGGIEEGCPTETQYDIFKADGTYVNSFTVDYANGAYHYYINWIDEDRIFIENIYYGDTNDSGDDRHVYKIIDIECNVLMETEIYPEDPYLNNFTSTGVYGIRREYKDGSFDGENVFLHCISYETGEFTELGCIANEGFKNIRVSPSGKYASVCEAGNFPGFSILEIG